MKKLKKLFGRRTRQPDIVHNAKFTEKQQKIADRMRTNRTVDGQARLGIAYGNAAPSQFRDDPIIAVANLGMKSFLKDGDSKTIKEFMIRQHLIDLANENPVKFLNNFKKMAVVLARREGIVGSQDKLAEEGFLMLKEYEKDALDKAKDRLMQLLEKIPEDQTELDRYINKMSAKSRITETDQELINLANKKYEEMYGQRTLVADDFAYYDTSPESKSRPSYNSQDFGLGDMDLHPTIRTAPVYSSVNPYDNSGLDFDFEDEEPDYLGGKKRRRKTRRRKRKMKRKSKKHKKKRKQKKTKKRRKSKSKRKTKSRK